MKILVTGGAGYIGSITVARLLKEGHEVVVFDNLVQGHEESIACPLVTGDLLYKARLHDSLSSFQFDAVIHFAAYLQVGESMRNPYKYFENNLMGGLNLLEFMKEKGIKYIVFSSTSALYAPPKVLPVKEDAPKEPQSVYGETKLTFEKILHWYDEIFGIKSISLRYFNAAGASRDGKLGEMHVPESHIIPVAIQKALENSEFTLFGNDYDTKDGTCIRDYIHVEDLAEGHILALKKLTETNKSNIYNLGTSLGHSNLEVIDMVKKISGVDFPVVVKPKRPGDLPVVYADSTKAKTELGFAPKYSDLETIIKTAWQWHKNRYKK